MEGQERQQQRRGAMDGDQRPRARLMLPDEARVRLAELISAHRTSLAGLSRMLGRGEGYVSDYLNRKVPYDLAPADRGRLARFFGADPETLRRQPPPRQHRHRR